MAIEDIFLVGILIFSIAMGGFLSYYMSDKILAKVQEVPVIKQNVQANESLRSYRTDVMPKFDYAFLVIVIGLMLGAFIFSWFMAGNALFSWIFIFIMLIFAALSPILSNVWVGATTTGELSSYVTRLPIMNHFVTYLPFYVVITGLLVAFILFGKPYMLGGEMSR